MLLVVILFKYSTEKLNTKQRFFIYKLSYLTDIYIDNRYHLAYLLLTFRRSKEK